MGYIYILVTIFLDGHAECQKAARIRDFVIPENAFMVTLRRLKTT
jgi:hypothetical protein